MAATPRNYWMLAVSPAYYEAVRKHGLTVLGLAKTHKKRAQRMEIGDRVLYFVTSELMFVATATVSGTYFEDESPIFPEGSGGETYPFRVKTRPGIVLDKNHQLDGRLIAPRLDYVRRWTPELWPLAFVDLLHLAPKADFLLLESEMKRARRRPRPAHPFGRPVPNGEDFACELDRSAAEAY